VLVAAETLDIRIKRAHQEITIDLLEHPQAQEETIVLLLLVLVQPVQWAVHLAEALPVVVQSGVPAPLLAAEVAKALALDLADVANAVATSLDLL
jgi:hypothetical protein